MSDTRPLHIADIKAKKQASGKIVALSLYDYAMAKIADQYCDILLVGDSLGMVVYGMENTLNVTLDMMINHGRAVARAAQHALVVVDMPFGCYEESQEQAYRNARKVMARTGAQAIKLEGGEVMAATVEFLVNRGIPVMGHVGLTPQHINRYGGFKVQGRDEDNARQIINDTIAIENAGAFACVLETIPKSLAKDITAKITIPTIGIGAGVHCDGQILVANDMLGMNKDKKSPKFVRQYTTLGGDIEQAMKNYQKSVHSEDPENRFPNDDESYS